MASKKAAAATAGATTATSSVKVPLKLFGLHARYATSLYVSAAKAKSTAAVEADVQKLDKLMKDVPKFATYLKNPIVKRTEKKTDLNKISKDMNAITRGFLALLADNGRLGHITPIFKSFQQLLDADRGIIRATVTSAYNIDSDADKESKKKELVEAMRNVFGVNKAQKLDVTYVHDPSILGGLQIQVGDKFLDLSVGSEINKIAQTLSQNV